AVRVLVGREDDLRHWQMLSRRAAARRLRQGLGRPDLKRVVGQEGECARLPGHKTGVGRRGYDRRPAEELGREVAAGVGNACSVGANLLRGWIEDGRRELLSRLREIAGRVGVKLLAEYVNGTVSEGERRGRLRAFRRVAEQNSRMCGIADVDDAHLVRRSE